MRVVVMGCVLLAVLVIFTAGKRKRGEAPVEAGTDREIEEAVLYAYGIEAELWENERGIRSKEDVFTLFRKGFGEKVARDLSEYYWMEGEDEDGEKFSVLRSGDPIFIPPDSIEVLKKKDDRVEVLLRYSKSDEGPVTYRAYSVRVVLRREGNVWKIYDADSGWF
jgi:hypothetical protein